jgi:hypothetical protein
MLRQAIETEVAGRVLLRAGNNIPGDAAFADMIQRRGPARKFEGMRLQNGTRESEAEMVGIDCQGR